LKISKLKNYLYIISLAALLLYVVSLRNIGGYKTLRKSIENTVIKKNTHLSYQKILKIIIRVFSMFGIKNCLTTSVIVFIKLKEAGYSPIIYFGNSLDLKEFHAWVEIDKIKFETNISSPSNFEINYKYP